MIGETHHCETLEELVVYKAWYDSPNFGHRLQFDTNGKATCPESGQVYELNNNVVKRIA